MPPPTRIHDIHNADAFVSTCINTSRIKLTPDERDDLHAEGMLILYTLAAKYQHHQPGHTQPGRFSGYAAAYLPKRLQDAWLRMHPEHLTTRTPNGKRTITYGTPRLSLQTDDLPQITATQTHTPIHHHLTNDHPATHSPLLTAALNSLPLQYRFGGLAHQLLKLVDDGTICTDTIAQRLRIDRRDVTRIQAALATAISTQQKAAA